MTNLGGRKKVSECIQSQFMASLMDFSIIKIASKIDFSYYLIVDKQV
jgi:hypothetical protein